MSTLLIVVSTITDHWHHELLIAALAALLVDVVSQGIALVSDYVRTQGS
ncbi:hypothetical protein ACFWC5_41065 [Streptomyces sp. NPDC060085]